MIEYSKASSADILSIEAYSYEQWGHLQTIKYMMKLRRAMNVVHGNPFLGAPRPNIYQECRVYPAGQHVLLYRPVKSGIEIGRIIHKNMDVSKIKSGFSDSA